MGLKIVYGKAGTGKTTYCFDEIKEIIKKDKKVYIITPEQFSFTAERKLMEVIDENAVLNAEVISFNRMAYRILNEVGGITQTGLTNCGKSMIIYDILHKNKNDLIFLNKSDENIEVVSNIITELKKHSISLEDLKEEQERNEDEYLKRKLQDVITVYDSYNTKIENGYIDENDLLTILSEKIDYTNEYNNCNFYIDEFAGFTKQEYEIIGKLLNIANNVTITLCTDNLIEPENPDTDIFYDNKKTVQKLLDVAKEKNIKVETVNLEDTKRFKNNELKHLEQNLYAVPYKKYKNKVENINLFLANNQYSEIENVAEQIVKKMQEGESYNNFSVITKDLGVYSNLIKVIFRKYNIPFFMDEKKDLNQNLIIKYVLSILEIYSKSFSYEAVFNYIKSGFLNLDNDDIFKLENYCIHWGIKGKKWYQEDWTAGIINEDSKKEVERLNGLRKEIINPILELKSKIDKTKNVEEITKNIYEFLIQNEIDKKLERKAQKLEDAGFIDIANEYTSGWNVLMSIFDELVLVFGDQKISYSDYIRILKVGIKNSEIGQIPGTQDQVIIGDVDRSRSHKVKYVFIIGLNDGVFPSINKSEGFLNDIDRSNLKENGIELAKGTLDKLYEENFNIYKAFTIAEDNLYLSYSSSDIEGKSLRPSILISKIKKIYPELIEESDILEKSNEILTANVTFEKLLRNIVEFNDGKEIDDIWFDIYKYYSNDEKWSNLLNISMDGLNYTNNPEKIQPELIDKLYGNKLRTSVSKLETYKSCPFSFHLKYGLNLKDQKGFKLEFIDTGSFMHEVIDEFFNRLLEDNIKPKELSEEELRKIVSSIIDEKLALTKNYIFMCSPKFRTQTNRLKRVIMQSIEFIIEEMKMSDFEIIGNEVEFKNGAKYEPIRIKSDSGKDIEIIGKIDRIDLAKNVEGQYVRIIDYKSSIKDINLNEVVAGLQIQLLTYLDATCKVEDMLPAGVLYFNLIDATVKAKKPMSEEEIKEELKKQFKMKGLILADVNVVKMMDKTLEKGWSKTIPAYIDKEGNLSKSMSNAVSKEQFEKLQKYTKKIIKDISNEILSGNIELKPYYKVKDKKTPCEYCDYKSICQFNKGFCGNDYNYIYNLDKNVVLDKLK